MRQQAQHSLLGHAAAPGEAEDMVVDGEAGPAQAPPQPLDPRPVERRPPGLVREGAAQCRDRLRGNPHRPHAVVAADCDHQRGDARMQMQVLVGVDMIERQAGRAEGLELGADFCRQLAANLRQKEEPHAGAGHVAVESTVGADQGRNRGGRRHRASVSPAPGAARSAAPASAGRAPLHPPPPARRPSGWRSTGYRVDTPLRPLR